MLASQSSSSFLFSRKSFSSFSSGYAFVHPRVLTCYYSYTWRRKLLLDKTFWNLSRCLYYFATNQKLFMSKWSIFYRIQWEKNFVVKEKFYITISLLFKGDFFWRRPKLQNFIILYEDQLNYVIKKMIYLLV